jgi:hypothetical protein
VTTSPSPSAIIFAMLRRKTRDTHNDDADHARGIAFAWQVHQAAQAWTASVDIKASIVVVVETAVASAATRALITNHGELHTATGLHLATSIAAVTALVAAVACALWVVFPRLERRRAARLAQTGLVYFGHLRARSPKDIATALAEITPEEELHQLASQLQITGELAWRKHAWLQASLALFALGALLLVISYVSF